VGPLAIWPPLMQGQFIEWNTRWGYYKHNITFGQGLKCAKSGNPTIDSKLQTFKCKCSVIKGHLEERY
jgi:hypothetical protein